MGLTPLFPHGGDDAPQAHTTHWQTMPQQVCDQTMPLTACCSISLISHMGLTPPFPHDGDEPDDVPQAHTTQLQMRLRPLAF